MVDTLDNTSYAENTKTQCEWAPLDQVAQNLIWTMVWLPELDPQLF
jgi:hypothetical protein